MGWRTRRRLPGPAARWSHFALACLLVVISLPVLAAVGLALRLWIRPLDVTDTARRLLAQAGAASVTVGRVRLAWSGWRDGPGAPILLMVDGLTVGPSHARHAGLGLDLRDALLGRIGIDGLSLDTASLALRRGADGGLGLQMAPDRAPGAPGASRGSTRGAGRAPALDLDGLRLVTVHDTRVTLAGLPGPGPGAGAGCKARIAELVLRPLAVRAAGGQEARMPGGRLAATLSCAGVSLALHGAGGSGANRLGANTPGANTPGANTPGAYGPGADGSGADGSGAGGPGAAGPEWRLDSGSVQPAAVARLWPALAPLARLGTPLRLHLAAGDWRASGRLAWPHRLALGADLGAGRLHSAPGDAGVALSGGAVHLVFVPGDGPGGGRWRDLQHWQAQGDGRLVLAADGTEVSFSLSGSQRGAAISVRLRAGLPHVEFANLATVWPAGLARGARAWVTQNITSGHGRDLAADVTLASSSGWAGLAVTSLSGGLAGDDLTLHWLRPIAPLQHMDAVLRLDGPDALDITSAHAVEDVPGRGRIVAGLSRMRITGLTRRDQFGLIDTHLQGDLADMLALLASPRLRLLSRHPVSFTDPSGRVALHLTLGVPLVEKVRADQIPVHVDATLSQVHLGHLAAGRDLEDGALSLEANNDGLSVEGTGRIGDAPSSLRYRLDFRAGDPQGVVETAHVSAAIDDAELRREGLDDAHRVSGNAALDLGYASRRDGSAEVDLHLDLAQAGIETPVWRKVAGAPAEASARLGLQDGRLVSIMGVRADGAGLVVRAHAEVQAGRASVLVVERFAVGRSRGSGRIVLPPGGAPSAAQPLRVTLRGPTLDLVPFLGGEGDGSRGGGSGPSHEAAKPLQAVGQLPAGSGAPPAAAQIVWQMDLAFDRMLISPSRSLVGVRATAEASGARIERAHLSVAGPTPVEASMTSQGAIRRLVVHAPDTGALLASLGVVQRITGGTLDLQGRLEDRPDGVRLAARARIGPFTVHDAPLAARLVRDLSVYGFLIGAPQKQIVVTRFEIPFTLQGDTLRLSDAHASNAALGSTLRGSIDLTRETLDLRGTIVPSYLLNALPGKLPGIGQVFSPEKGGGLLAATLRITGPLARPDIKVNPLALLAPGILRRLLFD